MDSEASGSLVVRFVEEVANRRNLAAIDELLSEDFALPPETDGALDRDGLRAALGYYFAAFPDLHYRVEDVIAEGGRVAVRLTMSGTHQGEYDGRQGTGKRF